MVHPAQGLSSTPAASWGRQQEALVLQLLRQQQQPTFCDEAFALSGRCSTPTR
jgi:hypothetical protein